MWSRSRLTRHWLERDTEGFQEGIAALVEFALTVYGWAHGAPLSLEPTPPKTPAPTSTGLTEFVCEARRFNSWNPPSWEMRSQMLDEQVSRAKFIGDCWKTWHGTDLDEYDPIGNMPPMTPTRFVEFILYCLDKAEEVGVVKGRVGRPMERPELVIADE